MRRAAVLVLCALVACSGGSRHTRFGLDSATPATRTHAAQPAAGATVALPRDPPPARLFAGSQSVTGALVRYCTTACAVVPAGSVRSVSTPVGAPLIFSLSQVPSEASLSIRPRSGGPPAHRVLAASSTIYWAATGAPGAYVLELSVLNGLTRVAWDFGLTIR